MKRDWEQDGKQEGEGRRDRWWSKRWREEGQTGERIQEKDGKRDGGQRERRADNQREGKQIEQMRRSERWRKRSFAH